MKMPGLVADVRAGLHAANAALDAAQKSFDAALLTAVRVADAEGIPPEGLLDFLYPPTQETTT